ncbi:hypothetical protein [Actinoplanes sp. NPDC049599]|uniref:hypothetical protein n=1 Tax=Actinoplanes sp. NPDC049599 TaxID=3363903 RepID=UPI00378C8322
MDAHEMVLGGTREPGAEEWACTTCDRRLLLRWSPVPVRVVLHPGDDRAVHVGARSDTRAGDPTEHEHDWLSGLGIRWD